MTKCVICEKANYCIASLKLSTLISGPGKDEHPKIWNSLYKISFGGHFSVCNFAGGNFPTATFTRTS